MAETITTDTQTQPEHPTAYKETQRLSVLWQRIALGAILRISPLSILPCYDAALKK